MWQPDDDIEAFRRQSRDAAPLTVAARSSTAQTISTATPTVISFDTVGSNNWGMVDISGAPTRITFVRQGIYTLAGRVIWEDNSTGQRYAAIRVNGTTIIQANRKVAAGASETEWAGRPRNFNRNDYVELLVEQTSGGDLDVTNGSIAATWLVRS